MKKITQFVVLCTLVAAPSVWADPVTITFDNPPCLELGGGIYSSDCYLDLGVRFSSGGAFTPPFGSSTFEIAADANAVSPPNVARQVLGFSGLNAEFLDPAGASGVSFDIVGTQPGQPAWSVVFASASFMDRITGFGDQRVSSPRCCIRGLTFFPGLRANAIDNLTHESGAVPEPSTVLLLGTGGAVLARRIRRLRAAARAA